MRGRKSTGILFLCLFVLAALLAGACSAPLTDRQATLQQYRKFFDRSLDEQYEAYQSYPIEKQFDIYIISMTKYDRPDAQLANIIASRRERAVPFLAGKLRQEKYPEYGGGSARTDEIKEKTIFIFRTMARFDYYAVRNDQYIIGLIRSEIDNMKDEQSQKFSRDHLSDILQEE